MKYDYQGSAKNQDQEIRRLLFFLKASLAKPQNQEDALSHDQPLCLPASYPRVYLTSISISTSPQLDPPSPSSTLFLPAVLLLPESLVPVLQFMQTQRHHRPDLQTLILLFSGADSAPESAQVLPSVFPIIRTGYLHPFIQFLGTMRACSGAQLCLTLCDPVDSSSQAPLSTRSPRQDTGVGYHFLLQGIFPTRDRTHVSCIDRWILYH